MLILGLYWSELNSKFQLKVNVFYFSRVIFESRQWASSRQVAVEIWVSSHYSTVQFVEKERAGYGRHSSDVLINPAFLYSNELNHHWITNRRVFFSADTMGKKDKSDRGKMDAILWNKHNLIKMLWTMQDLLLSNVNVHMFN